MVSLLHTLNQTQNSPGQTILLEELIRSLEANAFEAFLLIDRAGRILCLSHAARTLLQISPEATLKSGMPLDHILNAPLLTPWPAPATTQGKAKPQLREGPATLTHLQGDTETLLARASWLNYDFCLLNLKANLTQAALQQEISGLKQQVATLRQEITNYETTEATLKQTVRLFRNAFDQTSQLSSLLTPEGVMLEDNQTALDFCALSRADVAGMRFADLHCWQISPGTKQRLEHSILAASQGQTARYETEIWDPDNNVITIDFSIKPSLDEAGHIEFLIAEGRNITDRKQTELALQHSESRFRSVFENIPLVGVILDDQANILFANEFLLELTGWQKEDVLHQSWFDWFVPAAKQDEIYRQAFANFLGGEATSTHYEYAILTRWGEQRLIAWRFARTKRVPGAQFELACIGEDITERRRGERNLQQQAVQEQLLADITHQVRQSLDLETILKTAVNQIQHTLNAEQVHIFQILPDGKGQIIAQSEFIHPFKGTHNALAPYLPQPLWPFYLHRESQLVEAPIVRRGDHGSLQVWGLLIVHMNHRVNDFIEVEWFLRQLANQLAIAIYQSELYQQAQTELAYRQQTVNRFKHDALHDALTGLPNYTSLQQSLTQLMTSGDESPLGSRFAVLFLDLNDFKAINDTYGHSMGDQVLRVVAQRLKTCIRETDMVARRSGDEFLFLLHPIDGPKEVVDVARRVEQILKQPIVFEHQHMAVSGSIGIVLGPEAENDPEIMLRHADAAMYEAKRQGEFYRCWPL